MTRIAIVGAGVAGLGAAYALREADAEVTVFERSEAVGGRATTHRRNECVFDVGANYVKESEKVAGDEKADKHIDDLLTGELADGLVDTEGPVWIFNADGEISEGRGDDGPKWTYREGLASLGDRLREAADAEVRTGTEVETFAREDEKWRVETDSGETTADALVLTPPAPATAYLLDRADWDDPLRDDLVDAAANVPYRTLLSVALHYPDRTDLPYYGLVNTDKNHDLGWVSREECKPGHIPGDESLLIVQPSPEWSRHHYDDDDDEIAVAVADRTAELLDDPDRYQFDWAEVVRWRDALPDTGADRDTLERAQSAGLFFAGDWVVGEGRVHAALRSGLETGERIRETR
jgi:renalase